MIRWPSMDIGNTTIVLKCNFFIWKSLPFPQNFVFILIFNLETVKMYHKPFSSQKFVVLSPKSKVSIFLFQNYLAIVKFYLKTLFFSQNCNVLHQKFHIKKNLSSNSKVSFRNFKLFLICFIWRFLPFVWKFSLVLVLII